MSIAGITGQGLKAIGVAVLLLWACILAERVTVRKANQEAWRALRDLNSLRQKRAEPVSVPVPKIPRPARPTWG